MMVGRCLHSGIKLAEYTRRIVWKPRCGVTAYLRAREALGESSMLLHAPVRPEALEEGEGEQAVPRRTEAPDGAPLRHDAAARPEITDPPKPYMCTIAPSGERMKQ